MPGDAARPPLTRTARFAWGAVALLLIGVVALVVYALTDTPVTVRVVHRTATGKGVLHALATVPPAAFDQVGVSAPGTGLTLPTVVAATGTTTGKPTVLFVGAEYCPFCAAERWPLVVALSRFGTFGALDDMQSSATSVFPGIQTFSFVRAAYTSRYVAFDPVELYSNVPDSHGVYTRIAVLSPAQQAEVDRYGARDRGPAGSFPFVDVGNRLVSAEAAFSPAALEKLDQATIVTDLSTPAAPATPASRAILAASNLLTAGICAATGQQPAAVCGSRGVRAADAALGLG